MTNLCTRIVPTGSTVTTFGGGTYFNSDAQSARSNNASLYQSGSVLTGNNWILQIPVGGAFDAETFGITCQAFSNAAVSIPALQTSIQGLQTQMTALINGEVSRLPNPDILQAEGVIFGATVTAIAAVYGLKRIYRLLVPDVVAGHEQCHRIAGCVFPLFAHLVHLQMRLIRVVSLSALAVLASAAQAQQLDASKANNAFGYLTYSSVGAGQTGINYSNVASTGSTAAGAASVSTSGSSLVAVSRPYKVFNAAGNPVSTTVTGTITAARLAPILLKAAKLAPVLGTGIAIYDMLKETGIDAAKQSNGSINFSQQSSLFAVSCQAGNITGTLAGLGASCSGALSSYWRSNGYPSCSYNLSTSDYGSYGTIRLGYNGVSCGGYPNLTAYQSGTTVNTLTEQEVADAIANTSGWPSSSSMSKAVTDSLTVTGDQVVPSAPTVTGPSTSPGTTKTVTNPDGSKVVSTTNYNHTYEGNNITTGAVTTNNTYNTSNVITNTTTETTDAVPQPDPAKTDCEKNPDAIGCSKYGDPTSTDKLPNINADVSTIPSISFASNSSCPSPVTFTVLGRSLAFSYDSTCNVLESVVKPILLVLAAGLSLFVFVGGFKS